MIKFYREIEHTADMGLEIYGFTWSGLLRHSVYALTNTITDLKTVAARERKSLSVSAPRRDELLLNTLKEILLLFETEGFLTRYLQIQHLTDETLHASATGELFDANRHPLKTEIKAVTYHNLEVVHCWWGWRARVILDI